MIQSEIWVLTSLFQNEFEKKQQQQYQKGLKGNLVDKKKKGFIATKKQFKYIRLTDCQEQDTSLEP